MAKLLRFHGDNIVNLCMHNAKVTREYEDDDLESDNFAYINLSQTWESLGELYKELQCKYL